MGSIAREKPSRKVESGMPRLCGYPTRSGRSAHVECRGTARVSGVCVARSEHGKTYSRVPYSKKSQPGHRQTLGNLNQTDTRSQTVVK